MYKTIVVDYNPKTKKMAEDIEEQANALARDGYKVISFAITNSAKAIILADDGKEMDAE